MPGTYTCSKCNHSGSLREVCPSASGKAASVCPQCGELLDTLSNACAEDNTLPAGGRTQLPSAQGSDSGHYNTLHLERQTAALPPIAGYEVIREVGRGGMGVVYKARDPRLNRVVALKMILSGPHSSADQIARFQTETQAIAQLQHPNVVQIYDVGQADGHPYCAFEFVDGGSLGTKAFRKPQSARAAAELVATLAQAIHTAHLRGIVHRDLKPDNILLTADGTPKISDFGLAKRMEAEAGLTQSGSILGTPSYMAPEQASGNTKQVGPAADTWALGAILYYLLTGQPPFRGATMLDTLEQVRGKDPVAPSRLRPTLPRDLETICLKCLEKDPRRRYASAADLADDLRRFLAAEPIHTRPVGVMEHAIRHLKRRRLTAALVACLVVVVALLTSSLAWLWRSESSRHVSAHAGKPYELRLPKGLPSLSFPADNPLTVGRVELGKQLFFDKRLSADNSVSCASCHDPSKGWTDGQALAKGAGGSLGKRSSPSIVNVAYQNFLFWDGRAGSLEEQAMVPIQDPAEMAMPSVAALEARLNQIAGYRQQFEEVFGTRVTAANLVKALAAFQRTILSGDTPFDRYQAGETTALSDAALRGMKLFSHKAHCTACHSGPSFSDGAFHNIGIGVSAKNRDMGREKISGLLGDRGSFKTPTLREIARTAPYMHDGSLTSLAEVVEHYDRGGVANPQLDEDIFPLKLTVQEKRDLVTFLREGLTSSAYAFVSPPTLPE